MVGIKRRMTAWQVIKGAWLPSYLNHILNFTLQHPFPPSFTHRAASHRVSLLSDDVVQWQRMFDSVAFALKQQQQVLSPRPELHLQVLIIFIEEEHLHHYSEEEKTMITRRKGMEAFVNMFLLPCSFLLF